MSMIKLPAVTFLAVCVFTGCQSPPSPAPPASPTGAQGTRNNCYSLLHQLTEEEKDVSLLRFIKREHSDVKDLVKKIAATSKADSKLLEKFAKKDPSLYLGDIGLPSGEVATRAAIAATKKKALLDHSGDEFELTLLLSQAEALNYGWHLALVAAQNDSEPDRVRALQAMGDDMKVLYQKVYGLLLSKTVVTSPAAP